jgi:DNA-binding transcriptional LysR family regulator
MNIEDVRAFVAVVDAGSVGRAALRLNLTQPAISRRIQRLEEALGIVLLDRDSKPARPTRAGEAAYRRCVAVLRATEALARETRAALPAVPLRVGLTYAVSDSVFVPAIEALREACPGVSLHLIAAIVAAAPDRLLEEPAAMPLGFERVFVVASRATPVPARARLADIADQPWVINPEGCGFRDQLDRALAGSGRAMEVIAETWGTALQLALIGRGIGLGLVPARLLSESPHRAGLRIVEVEDFRPSLAIWMVRNSGAGGFAAGLDAIADSVRALLAASELGPLSAEA